MAEKINLIANRSMTYMTRRLVADAPFEAKPREAAILIAVGKARHVDEEAPAPKPVPKVKAPAARAARKTSSKPKPKA